MYKNNEFIQHLNLLFDNSRDFVFFMRKIGTDYEYVYVNKSAVDMLENDCIGKSVTEALDCDAAKFIIDHYDAALEKNEQHEFVDYSYFKLSVHKHETTVLPIIFEDEPYVLAITKEISYDEDIQDKYLFMRSIFFKTFLSTALVKSDGTLIEANPTFLNSLDLKIDDVRGKKFFELPIFSSQSACKIKKLILNTNTEESFDMQMITFVDHNKKEHYHMATFSPILKEDKVAAVFIIFQDVTEFIQQEKRLKSTMHGLNLFKKALNVAAEVTFTNLKGEIIEVNDRFIERTGYSREELIGQTHHIVNSGYHSSEFFKNLWETIKSGNVWRGEIRNKTKKGETYWVDTTIIPLTTPEGKTFQYITISFNVSEKKEMMIELRNIERTFNLITENTNDFIVVLNKYGDVTYSSPSYIRKLGYTEDELENIDYKKLIHPESLRTWHELLSKTEQVNKDGNIELMLLTKDGNKIWTEGNYSIVYDHTKQNVTQIIMVSREITERKERENSLLFLAYHDSLTQLPNRRYLQREFPLYIESANINYECLAVFFIDGDNFKKVNDKYGHDVGDEFLINFSKSLLKSVRKNDLVVRIGGDEFVIIIANLSRNKKILKRSLDRIILNVREHLAEGWQINGIKFEPTASIGVAIYPDDGQTLDELLEVSDRALYEAKQKAKNSQ